MSSGARTWIFAGGGISRTSPGSAERLVRIADRLARKGPVILAAAACDVELPAGTSFETIPRWGIPAGIGPEDRILVSTSVPGPVAWSLLRSRHPFELDAYNIPELELLQIEPEGAPAKVSVVRMRRARRLGWLAACADRVFVSNRGQAMFLAGLAYPLHGERTGNLVRGLAARIVEMPMGCGEPFVETTENPYPAWIGERPVFLWGGGIYPWYDLGTIVETFRRLRDRGSPAVLYFLSTAIHGAGDGFQRAIQATLESAGTLGLVGVNIGFQEGSVPPALLGGYLRHCRAGILTNAPFLETMGSWRTRYLDLVRAGRPAVVAGRDPLAERMAAAGAASLVPWGDADALADAVHGLAMDADRAREMGAAAGAMRANLSWERLLSPLDLPHPAGAEWTKRSARPSLLAIARHYLPLPQF